MQINKKQLHITGKHNTFLLNILKLEMRGKA